MAEKQEIFAQVKEHLVGRGLDAGNVTIKAHLTDDLDLDSLDTMELTVAMEDRFGIEIPDSELEDLATIEDAVTLIESKLAVKA